MGYSTNFYGILKFNNPLSVEQDAFLRTICSGEMEDVDEHPEWLKPSNYHGYIQLVISKDQSGIEWDGNEKFYDAVDAVNTVIMTMQDKFPEFGLKGSLLAQGEEIRDRWHLVISNGIAEKRQMTMEIKLFEIRDKGTFMPMFAFSTSSENEMQNYLLRRAGFAPGSDLIMFGYLEGHSPANYDVYEWNDRTKATAHQYIQTHWNELKDGDVIDVEWILKESAEKKISEKFETYY